MLDINFIRENLALVEKSTKEKGYNIDLKKLLELDDKRKKSLGEVEKLLAHTSGDERTGVAIVVRALEEPMRQVAINAGLDGSVVIDKVRRSRKVGYGFNVFTEEFTDMIEAGVVDPVKVTRSALKNAASVAAMVLTTESLVTEKPEYQGRFINEVAEKMHQVPKPSGNW